MGTNSDFSRLDRALIRKLLELVDVTAEIAPKTRPFIRLIRELDIEAIDDVMRPQSRVKSFIDTEADLLAENTVERPTDIDAS